MKPEINKPVPHKGHCCSRSQKIWGVVALVGLFACGWMVGACINGWRNHDAVAAETDAPASECGIIEEYLLRELDTVNSVKERRDIFMKLMQYGCVENRAQYSAHLKALDIAYGNNNNAPAPHQVRTCDQIEKELIERINDGSSTQVHINNAKIYANLSERGCPEDSEKFVSLAKQELALARALQDDGFNNADTIKMVETYKRLNMQAAAEEIFDKVKKLTNPAIDFIIQVEKIINE